MKSFRCQSPSVATVALIALVVVTWLVPVATVSAQTASPAVAPAKPAQTAKPAKRAGTPSEPAFKLVLEPRAIELLKATSAKLAAARSMSFTAAVSYEYPSKLGPPILYTARYDVTLQRPNKLKVVMPGDGPVSEFYYDGKVMAAFAPAENLLAVADAPPTIDAALKAAYDTAAIYYPFTDLIAADPYAALADGAILAFYIGPSGVVGGVKTDMVAWASSDVFLQIWIGADDKLPRRVRAIYRTDPLELRHQVDLSDWKLDGPIAQDAFAPQNAQTAKRIAFASPVESAPAGVKPMAPKRVTKAAPAPTQPKAQ